MRKAVAAAAVLLVLVVITSGSATLAAARALPGEQPVSPGISTNIATPGLHGLLPYRHDEVNRDTTPHDPRKRSAPTRCCNQEEAGRPKP
ncbi:hypothetical protein HU200_004083 [Digitaria exilis]|uniref:Secreted protein n=1 Tax=Digitaria exilis TaxID=1010633 RepID=A0A835FVC3_9POAL|nr:hypothetical protein HU200_004083 [Digitaria exilis]